MPNSNQAMNNLAQHIASVLKRLQEVENRLETTNDRLMDLARASKERFDRMQSVVGSLDFSHKRANQELRGEVAKVTGQITQKRVVDTKLQEVMSNHSFLVAQFEGRIQDLKKMISAQEMKIMELEARVKIAESLRR